MARTEVRDAVVQVVMGGASDQSLCILRLRAVVAAGGLSADTTELVNAMIFSLEKARDLLVSLTEVIDAKLVDA
jgi:hypothetical protein